MAQQHAATRDQTEWSKPKPGHTEYLRHALTKSGRSPFDLMSEALGLQLGRGKLPLHEYVQYGVYDNKRYNAEDRSRFISNTLHWPITRACCDMTWQAATEDKWLCSHILGPTGIPVPQTLAVIDRTDRRYPGTHKISTASDLRDFVVSLKGQPAFGKENRGICSFGAFLVLEGDRDRLHLKNEGWLDYEACMNQFIGSTPYLIQSLVHNHRFFDRYTANLATVRVCIMLTDGGVRIPFAVLKLPSGENLADSFWRQGNLACNLDSQTGTILMARSKEVLGTLDHRAHPDTGAPLVGESVPMWKQVLELAHSCATMFRPVRYQSMDIAVTKDGPVLIEINTGGGFDLPQLASGQGFLTDEVIEFFQSCGYKKL